MRNSLIYLALFLCFFIHPLDISGQMLINNSLPGPKQEELRPEPLDLSVSLNEKSNEADKNTKKAEKSKFGATNDRIKENNKKNYAIKYSEPINSKKINQIKEDKLQATGIGVGVKEQGIVIPRNEASSALSSYLEENKIDKAFQRSIVGSERKKQEATKAEKKPFKKPPSVSLRVKGNKPSEE